METIKSKALDDNLAVTRGKQIVIPEEDLWLLGQARDFYGIYTKVSAFLEEFHHPYSNLEVALNLLRQNVISNLWLFMKIPESDKAISRITVFYLHIFNTADKKNLKKKVIQDFLYFYLAVTEYDRTAPETLSLLSQTITDWYNTHQELFIYLSTPCRNAFLKLAENKKVSTTFAFSLLKKILHSNLQHWKKNTSLSRWESQNKVTFSTEDELIHHRVGTIFIENCLQELNESNTLDKLANIPTYSEIMNRHRENIVHLKSLPLKINYVFYLFSLLDMADLTDHLLWDLNKLLASLHDELTVNEIYDLIDSIFELLCTFRTTHPSIILDCVSTIGKALIKKENLKLSQKCIDNVIRLGFIGPGKIAIDKNWQITADKNHVKNIRIWLQLISIDPMNCKALLSTLIISLIQKGVFISDTDLFQKDVSSFLNSDIKPLYVHIKHLLRLFPVFFNEIGAEGEIRDISTTIDEIFNRNDKLIHFLRKQIHTESNNTHVNLIKKILYYWFDLDPTHLSGIVPEDIFALIRDPDRISIKQNEVVVNFLQRHSLTPNSLLLLSWQKIARYFESSDEECKYTSRLHKLLQLYYLLLDKYQLNPFDIFKFLNHYSFFTKREQSKLNHFLERHDYDNSIKQILGYMGTLNQVILDRKPSKGWENIYFKRHIAAGIPSMYGKYHEPKIEAMGMIFRLENLIKRLIEKNIKQLNLSYISAKTLRRIIKILELFDTGLKQEGLKNEAFGSALDMLKSSIRIANLSVDQYLDIFNLMKDSINDIINEYYYHFYEQELNPLPLSTKNNQKSSLKDCPPHKFAEEFYRTLLSSSFLVQELDNFISQIILSLNEMKSLFSASDITKVINYNPDLIIFQLHTKNSRVDNQVLLGSKAYFLKKMLQYEFPIPPGFVISTELFRNKHIINTHPNIYNEFDSFLLANIEKIEFVSNLKYGNTLAPLLFSVRSGAPMSLPGAMNTFLNIGMNDEITQELSHQNNYAWTAWDCYRRLLQSWGMAYGMNRDIFDNIMIKYKRMYKVKLKTQFSPLQMKKMVFDYKKTLQENGVEFEQDPYKQLKLAIFHVLDSWNTDLAKLYRQKLHIADEWGTAVIVQKMVLGNISLHSGTGVVFTHSDKSTKPGISLNGDFTLCSQGEDVVAGLVHTLPISEEQVPPAKRNNNNISLEKDFPNIYKKLQRLAYHLVEVRGYQHQEIEFTFEGNQEEKLFILQTRNQIIQKPAQYTVFKAKKQELKHLSNGIGIGKGVINGIIVFTREDIERYRKRKTRLILVRPDTVPEDMDLLFDCHGLLTARGGITSHAAVTATRLGLVGIVNCRELKVFEHEAYCKISNHKLFPGDKISLDSSNGAIYYGNYPTEKIESVK